MSRKPAYESLEALLREIDRRYDAAREGYEYDFDSEIAPFLNDNKEMVDNIILFDTDQRFNAVARDKMIEELMELLMSCHAGHSSMKAYKEKFKFINMWVKHIKKEGL